MDANGDDAGLQYRHLLPADQGFTTDQLTEPEKYPTEWMLEWIRRAYWQNPVIETLPWGLLPMVTSEPMVPT